MSPTAATANNFNPETNGNRSVTLTFTQTCAVGYVVNSTRLQDATSGRNLSGNLFTIVNLSVNDQLTVNWTVFVTSG